VRRTIDLNADVGEERGDDAALLAQVASANVAAGAHAGGGEVLRATVLLAVAAGCAVGAHPSYPDREGFGRRRPPAFASPESLTQELVAQVLLVGQEAESAGAHLIHVKPHGSLYNDAADDPVVANCLVDAMTRSARHLGLTLSLMGLPDSVLEDTAHANGVPFIREAFADRAYDDHGRLVPRSVPGAVLESEEQVRERVIDIAVHGRVRTASGRTLPIRVHSICVHGDSPEAPELAAAARAELTAAGFTLAPASP
jgi:UPF0271 protein